MVVHSQEKEGGKYLVNYNAVVKAAEQNYYFTAPTPEQLFHQVGGLLARLRLHKDDGPSLLLISDCADWITGWYESTAIAWKSSIMCWWHLKRKCCSLVGKGISNLTERDRIKAELLALLWRGEVSAACGYLQQLITDYEDAISTIEIKSIKKLIKLREYLLLRASHIPNYLERVKNREWIANSHVEKFNDVSISTRCKKKNGMRWTQKGVGAIALIEVARRNGELDKWHQMRKLPGWPSAA